MIIKNLSKPYLRDWTLPFEETAPLNKSNDSKLALPLVSPARMTNPINSNSKHICLLDLFNLMQAIYDFLSTEIRTFKNLRVILGKIKDF